MFRRSCALARALKSSAIVLLTTVHAAFRAQKLSGTQVPAFSFDCKIGEK
jgi:hypothetical protein